MQCYVHRIHSSLLLFLDFMHLMIEYSFFNNILLYEIVENLNRIYWGQTLPEFFNQFPYRSTQIEATFRPTLLANIYVVSICGSHQHVGEGKNASKCCANIGQHCWPVSQVSSIWYTCQHFGQQFGQHFGQRFFSIIFGFFYVIRIFISFYFPSNVFLPFLFLFWEKSKCWPKCCHVHSKSHQHIGWNVGQNVGRNVGSICPDLTRVWLQ